MIVPHINKIATAVPSNQVHSSFVQFKRLMLSDKRKRFIFDKLVERGQIEKRWSCLEAAPDSMSALARGEVFYAPGQFPSTGTRMRLYEKEAPVLARKAVEGLQLGGRAKEITHLIVTSCTGFYAPGIDLDLVALCGLNPSVERTVVGFMGCYAAINGLKIARHIVRSEPAAKVLLVSVELCTLHFQETYELEAMIPFLLFADGCAAALITADPDGLALESFYATVLPHAADQMAWHIRDLGFDMTLSSRIPSSVSEALRVAAAKILSGGAPEDIGMWAVHPGGRAVLDAVEAAFRLPRVALAASRKVLCDFGNMSSATVLFVLKALMDETVSGASGCAMSFGPGLTAETMLFKAA